MEEHILVPIDGSEQSERAFSYALERFPDDPMTVLSVIDPMDVEAVAEPPGAPYESPFGVPGVSEEWFEQAKEEAEARVADAAERAAEAGVDCETAVEVGRPAHTIVDYAEDHDCDHVVMGSHGRSGVERVLLGSVAETVVRRADQPVTIVR